MFRILFSISKICFSLILDIFDDPGAGSVSFTAMPVGQGQVQELPNTGLVSADLSNFWPLVVVRQDCSDNQCVMCNV